MKFVAGTLKRLRSSSNRSDDPISVDIPAARVGSDEMSLPGGSAEQAAPIFTGIFEAETSAESFHVANRQAPAVGQRVIVHAPAKPADEVDWEFEPTEDNRSEPFSQSSTPLLTGASVQPAAPGKLMPHQRSLLRLKRYNERERRRVTAAAIEKLGVQGSLSDKELSLFKSALRAASTEEALKDDVILLMSFYSDILVYMEEGLQSNQTSPTTPDVLL